jgi:glutathione synthase/RimK-type ligase-like ATP-grasp enzyme
VELDGDVAERCRRVMEALGLVFGAIDLVVTPAGETVFLEVNPEGQFLWVEEATGLPMVEALSDLLLEGCVDEPGSGQAEDAGVDVRR